MELNVIDRSAISALEEKQDETKALMASFTLKRQFTIQPTLYCWRVGVCVCHLGISLHMLINKAPGT